MTMGWEAWTAFVVIGMALYGLARNLAGPDVVLTASAVLLTALSVVSDRFPAPRQMAALAGNEGVLTVAVLFVVAAALTETGGMGLMTERLLGVPRSTRDAQLRLMLPVASVSAFLNNTPVVAMFMPVVGDWSKKTGISASKLYLPLSYAAVLGGSCTLIGTSTNLVVQAQLVDWRRTDPSIEVLSMFTLTPIGVPLALAGVAYIVFASKRWLPERRAFLEQVSDARQYTVEMLVEPGSPIHGQTIEAVGLRRLPGMFLSTIERGGDTMVAVGPDQVLRERDRLVFVGVVESVADLQRVRGLVPATDQVFKITSSHLNRLLVEAVVADTSPLVGQSIREGRFRDRYDAAVIAVCRNGERLPGKIGDITLRPGDALLLQAHLGFVRRYRNSRDFLLVAALDGWRPARHHRAWVAIAIAAGMVALASLEHLTGVTTFGAALMAATLMGAAGCLSSEQARRSIDLSVLVAIVSALVVGRAMETTGLAQVVAGVLIGLFKGLGPWGVLAGVYLLALVFTELVTNNAAAALALPIAKATATGLGISFLPFAVAIAIAASAGFATPLGYQTHLMVYGPGGYRFGDFVRMGLPLDLICMSIAVTLTPIFYPF
jgi:di/tricarboxylate transporter